MRRQSFVFTLALLLPLSAWASSTRSADAAATADKPSIPAYKAPAPAQPQPTFQIEAGLNGDVFPALANHESFLPAEQRRWGTVNLTINNFSDTLLRARVTVHIPGWSDQEIQMAELEAGEKRTLRFAPSFLPRLFANREIAAATALVAVHDMGGRLLYTATAPMRLRAAGDMYWGPKFKYAPFIAAWVTPHDARVEQILSRAKELMPGRRLPGYEEWKPLAEQAASTRLQSRSIYRALQLRGVSYVKSSTTFGHHQQVSQRVRLPRESLRQISANCIDAVVLYASLFENLGMDPVVVLVPGHAYVGVRLGIGSKEFLYIDVAMTGRATFDAAVAAAGRGLRKHAGQVSQISIAEARQQGIYPMPDPTPASVAAELRPATPAQ